LVKGDYVIGREAADRLLARDDVEPLHVNDRTDAFRMLGLRPDELPPAVAQTIQRTRSYLDLAA
jgi:hypothetical protein